MIRILVGFTLIFLLSACSSNQKAGVVYHDRFDFSKVKSYSLYGRNSIFSEAQNLLDTRRNAIEIAIERTMASKKFSYAAIDAADVIITYHVFNGKQGDFSKYNQVVHFCAHCLRATTWQTENQYAKVSQGSIVLDIFDPKQSRSVWRSIYPLNIKDKDNSAKTNDKIKHAVAAMLAQYPQVLTNKKLVN